MNLAYRKFQMTSCSILWYRVVGDGGSNGSTSGWTKSERRPPAVLENFEWPCLWILEWVIRSTFMNYRAASEEYKALPIIVSSERTTSPTGLYSIRSNSVAVCANNKHFTSSKRFAHARPYVLYDVITPKSMSIRLPIRSALALSNEMNRYRPATRHLAGGFEYC